MKNNPQSNNSKKQMSQLNKKLKNLNFQKAPIDSNIQNLALSPNQIQQQQIPIILPNTDVLGSNSITKSNPFSNKYQAPPLIQKNSSLLQTTTNESSLFFENDFESKPRISEINASEDQSLHVVSLIITIIAGQSYDHLFREVPQKAPEGRVALFEINEKAIPYFLDKFKKKEFSIEFTKSNYEFVEKINEIFDYLEQIEPECVMFNYECCSGCGDFNFLLSQETNELIDLVMKKKMIFMFSDFSVKSLLETWDENLFGKNPFRKIGSCSSEFKLNFDPETLKKCESPQLQIVGTLCESGECCINVMGGTIVFGVDKEKVDSEVYELKVLSIVDNKNAFIIQSNVSDFENKPQKEVENLPDKNLKNIKFHKPEKFEGKIQEVDKFYVDLSACARSLFREL